ncbi:unnamed protein product [Moneuplotes crassus]|uniref:Uncharacterized protein n=1 Tax=Euplotes crassus TaxID=5936 RepID=A0AAD1U2H5_EUPCR|nr:unnamed protein product [Moneuplotes crassus]
MARYAPLQSIKDRRLVKGKLKRKHLFSKQSQICNVLPYYAHISECDILMRQFSGISRKLWVERLPMWVNYIGENTRPIFIDSRTISHWIDDKCLYNCILVFDQYQIQTKQCATKTLQFIKSIPSVSQIKSLVIVKNFSYTKVHQDKIDPQNAIQNIKIIAQALGPNTLERSVTKNFRNFKEIFYSDIISKVYFKGPLNKELLIFPKVNSSNKIVLVNSKYIVNNKWIRLNKNTKKENYPDLCCISLDDIEKPVFSEIKEVSVCGFKNEFFIDNQDFRSIIDQLYPNLAKIELCRSICRNNWHAYQLCDLIKGRMMKSVLASGSDVKCTVIKIRSERAMLASAFKNGILPKIYEFEVEAYVKKIGFVCRLALLILFCNNINCELKGREYFSKHGNGQWLMIPISEIKSIETNHCSITKWEIYKVTSFFPTSEPSPPTSSLQISKLASNWEFYDKLRCQILTIYRIGTGTHDTPACTSSMSKSLFSFTAEKESKICLEMPLFNTSDPSYEEFTVEKLGKFRRLSLILFMDVDSSGTETEKMLEKVEVISQCRNLVSVRVILVEKDRDSVMISPKCTEMLRKYLKGIKWRPDIKISMENWSFLNKYYKK